MAAVKAHPKGTVLKIHVQPKAKKTEIVGYHGEALKIRVSAPATEGRANAALLEFLADRLKVKKKDLSLLSGERSREKLILVSGKTPEEIQRLLG